MKTKETLAALSALASEARLEVFRLLVRRGPEGYTPTELTQRLRVPAPTLSFHLRALVNAELVTARRAGRNLYYSANLERIRAVTGFLMDNCCSLANEARGATCQPLCDQASLKSTQRRQRA